MPGPADKIYLEPAQRKLIASIVAAGHTPLIQVNGIYAFITSAPPVITTHGNNADCPQVQDGTWTRCMSHGASTERTIESDLKEDR